MDPNTSMAAGLGVWAESWWELGDYLGHWASLNMPLQWNVTRIQRPLVGLSKCTHTTNGHIAC